jgi:hypothetical protein
MAGLLRIFFLSFIEKGKIMWFMSNYGFLLKKELRCKEEQNNDPPV